jgi:LysR family transcriptional regulator, glycine cleavage system transcriptional activator
MQKRIPPLNALRAFEAASRLGSFAKAGQELHVTAAAISHQIKQLESWLGFEVFERHARGIALNGNGLEYAARTREAFDRLMMSTVAARMHRHHRIVTVRCQFSIASMWLVPRLDRLRAALPGIELKVMADATASLTPKVEADLNIYFAQPALTALVQTPMLPYELAVFASPQLIRSGMPSPAQVLQGPLLHNALEDRSASTHGFEDWFAACGLPASPLKTGLRFNLLHLSAQACIQGMGYALLPVALCDEWVREGKLVQLAGPVLTAGQTFHMLHKKRLPEDVRQVRDWLMASAPLSVTH